MSLTQSSRVRFGAFELDLRAGELHGDGETVLLRQQPFQLLLILVERNGEIATREEIKKKLWPNDTIVEFDHSINAAIRKLRNALGDSADDPQYIQTVARRGYRLMVPVVWLESAAPDLPPDKTPATSLDTPANAELAIGSLTGRTVSHYRVLDVIGGGGMGVVYRAEDLKLGRAVALKFLPEDLSDDPKALERFEREARAVSSLDHPNIGSIYEFGEHEGHSFIVMQLLHGRTLREYLAAGAFRLSDPAGLEIAIQVAAGLEAAHEKGIIHRDIKPANIFITEKNVAKILDFGLAKVLETIESATASIQAEEGGTNTHDGTLVGAAPDLTSNTTPVQKGKTLTQPGVKLGTAGYMSPEQVRGEPLDARTDIFSFGLVLYEMATGRRAFMAETEEILNDAIANREPKSVHELAPTISPKLEAIIRMCLKKDPEQRFASAADIRADLESLLHGRQAIMPKLPWSRGWRWCVAAALLMAVPVAAFLSWRSRHVIKLTGKDTIVLADVTNSTTDPVFSDALNTALRVEMEQTPFLNVIAPDKIRGALREANLQENSRLTADIANKICLRTSSKAVVSGSIADAGNHYRIALRAVECQAGRTIATSEVEADHRNEVVKMLGGAGAKLRRQLGEPEALLQRFNQPLERATSSSLDALQAYTEGRTRMQTDSTQLSALPYFKRAVDLDPSLAMAYAYLGALYYDRNEFVLAMQNAKKAFELRERLDQRSRWFTESLYYDIGTGELEKANEVYRQWINIFPTDAWPHIDFFASLRALGQHEQALIEAREAARLSPTSVTYLNLMWGYLHMNRLDEAKAVFAEAQALKVDDYVLRSSRYMLAFFENDKVTMEQELAWAMSHPEGKEWAIQQQGDTAVHLGRFVAARKFYSKMRGYDPDSADNMASSALQQLEIGNLGLAKQIGFRALTGDASPSVKATLALVFARTGAASQAASLIEEISRLYPLSTLIQEYVLPTIKAGIELDKNNAGSAVRILRAAAPYELSSSTTAFDSLYPVYIRGLAYLKLGEAREAAAEFQKMVDHPGIVQDSITSPLSYLQLGRAQMLMGDKEAARKSYQEFLSLWKDADPDIPIYKQAKAEYAKLN